MIRPGGLGGVGAASLGGLDGDDVLRNVELGAGAYGTVLVDFDLEVSGELFHDVALYVDGEHSGFGEVTGTDLPPLGDGGHEVGLLPVRVTDNAPEFYLEEWSTRAIVCWGPVAQTDVAGYNVFTDEGSGSATTLLDSVTVIEGARGVLDPAGGGTGRVRIYGEFSQPDSGTINDTWAVVVDAAGTGFQLDTGGGAEGTVRPIREGSVYTLANGLKCAFLDGVSEFSATDRYEFFVGPRTFYVSGELSVETAFAVSAFDVAGNESSKSSEKSVVPDPWPEPPTGLGISWDADDREVTITWTDPTDVSVDYVEVYSNYDEVSEELGAYVNLGGWNAQLAVASGGSATIEVASGVTGTFLAYVRSFDSVKDRRECNAGLLRVELTDDARSGELGVPELVSAVPLAGGKALLTFRADVEEVPPTNVRIYHNSTENWSGATLEDTESWDPVAGAAQFPYATMTFETETFSGTRYYGVRTEDASGDPSDRSNLIGVTADNSAPDTPVLC